MLILESFEKSYYKYKLVIILSKIIIITIIFFKSLIFLKFENNLQSIIYHKNKKIKYPYKINLSKINKQLDLYLEINFFKYFFSFKYNVVEIEYNILFYDKKRNLIKPSDLTLFNDFHIFCHIKKRNHIYIESIANIYHNKYNCVEYFSLNDKLKLGIKIYKNNKLFLAKYFFNNNFINFNNQCYINDNKFDPFFINFKYIFLYENFTNNKKKSFNNILLKKSFKVFPNCSIKSKISKIKNSWYFKNIYNHFYCFCIGNNCLIKNIPQECKYRLYLSIIDNNKYLYNKTYYLFADFLFEDRATGDAYLIFKEMINQNISAYYVTERKDIYKKYYNPNESHQRVIQITNKQYYILGDTLEKYLSLFLKLKAVISGAEFYSIDNIFYNIDYITFICVGHGVNYFKPFLYNNYYGCQRYNKILIPSQKIISIAQRYGWKEDNIIKLGLPKWDIFDDYNLKMKKSYKEEKILSKYIFLMFTWRELQNGRKISNHYFKNIIRLINNNILNKELKKNNITLLISLHHNLQEKKNMIKINDNIEYIQQENILDSLTKSNLIISDFSSVIFDIIYQKKPIIIYIPDYDDSTIKFIYSKDYYDVITSLKNNSIYFENKFFDIEKTVNKIIYYIYNDFKIEKKLEKFYESFSFIRYNSNINKFINYLKNLT